MLVREIYRTDAFTKWFKKLKDRTGKALIYKRIERLAEGNAGDVAPIGEGLSEMRIHYAPAIGFITKIPERKLLSFFAVETNRPRRLIL
jgi:putative addiction module killer protein